MNSPSPEFRHAPAACPVTVPGLIVTTLAPAIAGRLRRLPRVEQVLGAGEDQRFGLDRGQRLGGVAVEARRGADVMPLIGPGLVDPVVGVEGFQQNSSPAVAARQ